MSRAALVYPKQVKGSGPKDYLKITVATQGGDGVYQFFGRNGRAKTKAPTEKAQATIYLAMPRQLSVSYGMSYQGVDLGSIGGQLIGIGAELATSGNVGSIAQDLSSAANNALPEMGLNLAAQGINTAINAMGFAGGVDANSISALMQGKILNPFREITFKGANYRTHNFTVKMVAHNDTEAKEIKQIVNTLRYYMHPTLTGESKYFNQASSRTQTTQSQTTSQQTTSLGGFDASKAFGNSRWLGIPSYFDLAFVRMNEPSNSGGRVALTSAKEIKDIFRPGACVLQSFNVNFSPDGQYVSTKDGYVMAVQIQMAFKETVMLHRAALNELNEGI